MYEGLPPFKAPGFCFPLENAAVPQPLGLLSNHREHPQRPHPLVYAFSGHFQGLLALGGRGPLTWWRGAYKDSPGKWGVLLPPSLSSMCDLQVPEKTAQSEAGKSGVPHTAKANVAQRRPGQQVLGG